MGGGGELTDVTNGPMKAEVFPVTLKREKKRNSLPATPRDQHARFSGRKAKLTLRDDF